MFIKSLSIQNFKNHLSANFDFSPQINCFTGNNGVGKTNILDALHYLSVGKSFLSNTDVNNIAYNEDFFTLEGIVSNGEKEDVIRIIQSRDSR